MVLQTIDQAPIIEPFVVQQSDVDLFSFDDLDSYLPTISSSPRSKVGYAQQHRVTCCSSLPEESKDVAADDDVDVDVGHAKLPLPYPTTDLDSFRSYSSKRAGSISRRSSLCSTTSSNSSICSKSFGFNDGDESIASSHADDASTPLSSRSRKSKRSSKLHHLKQQQQQLQHHRHHQMVPPKHVAFTPKITVRCIPSVDDYTENELSQVWYTEAELQSIKRDAQELILKAKNKEISHRAPELRGLHMTQKRQRRSLWIMALTSVLDEQERQVRNGIPRDERVAIEKLAKIYHSFAFSAVQIAQKIGQDDAIAAAIAASSSS